jgi:hypothetical protein
MTQKTLEGVKIGSLVKCVSREGVAQRMNTGALG